MKDELYNVKMHQLGEIIKNNNYPSQEIKRQDYILVNYLLDLIKEENYQSKTKEKIIQALEEAFEKTNKQDIKDGIFNEYMDYLSKTIKNNKIINTLKKYKDNYSIIYDILFIPEINKLSTKHKEEIIKVTLEEEIAREEYIDTFFKNIPKQKRRNLKSIISTTAKKYFDTIKSIYAYNIEEYKNELETSGRWIFTLNIFENTYTIDDEKHWFNFYNFLNVPYKPIIEKNLEKYHLSLVLDYFNTYKTKQNKIDCSIELLNLDNDQIAENKNVLKYAITEKAVSKIRETYNNLSKYITNNQLLSKIGMEPLYQNKQNKNALSLYQIYMGIAIEQNDLLPLGDVFAPYEISTDNKMRIQELWTNIIMKEMFEKYSLWLYNVDYLLFDKVYQENKKEFMNIINSSPINVKAIYKKFKESILNITSKVLEDNKGLFYDSIDNESLNRITIKNQKEKEFALSILKDLLSGKTEHSYNKDRKDKNDYPNINEEDKKRIIDDMYAATYIHINENPCPSTYEPKITADQSEYNYDYLSLLEENKKLLEELKNSTKELYLNLEGYYNKNDSLYNKVQKHIINELDLKALFGPNTNRDVAKMLDVIESEQKKYSFITFINNYYNYLNINCINCRIYVDNIIEFFYNKYSQIMNQLSEKNIERKTEEDFIEYLLFGAENYIQRIIQNIEDLKHFELSDFNRYLDYIKDEYISIFWKSLLTMFQRV